MVRVAVQSQASKNRVAKLTYRLRGPYVIVDILEHGEYNLQKFGKSDGPKVKHHAENISKAFNIKLYNDLWFSHPTTASPPQLLRALDEDDPHERVKSSAQDAVTVTRMPGLFRVPVETSELGFESPS